MEIKKLEEQQYEESMKLSMYAFQYKVPESDIPKRKEMLKDHNVLCVWDAKQLVAKLHILPLSVYVNGNTWKMGGVAGVATYPEYRRKGYVKALIIESLKEMRQEGQILSFLHPFDIHFYRNFGWEILSDYRKSIIEKIDLKKLENVSGNIKRYKKEDHSPLIEKIYNEYASKYTGMLQRDTKWWLNSIYSDSQIAVYLDENGNGQGYLLYSVKDNEMDVQEFVTLNHESAKGLWNFICQHDSMINKVKILTSVHDSFPYYIKQPKVQMEVFPYFMARIVDVEICLKKFTFNKVDKSVFLHVEDTFASWNNGSFLISNEEIKVFKEKDGARCVQEPKVGIKLNINSLAAILLGYKRPYELFELGEVVGRTDDMEALEQLIPKQKSFFYDFF